MCVKLSINRQNNMKKLAITISMLVTVVAAFAWGQKGHDVTAYVAECHLTPATRQAVDSILGNKSMVYWANWLDNASHTPDYAYTKTWHYKNIDADVAYEDAPLNDKGDVVTGTREMIAILADSVSTLSQKQLALKILIHLVGDLHQPMHMGHLSDLGGNRVKMRFFERDTNLHSIWDGSLMNSGHSWTYTEWREQLDRLAPEAAEAESAGTVDDWARETFAIATRVYDYFPTGTKVSYNQIAMWTPVIEQQLLRGGLRLARILNALYDPTSTTTPSDF